MNHLLGDALGEGTLFAKDRGVKLLGNSGMRCHDHAFGEPFYVIIGYRGTSCCVCVFRVVQTGWLEDEEPLASRLYCRFDSARVTYTGNMVGIHVKGRDQSSMYL